MHLSSSMKTVLSYDQFFRNLDFVAHRHDETEFLRLWGYFVDVDEQTVVFWRHEPGPFYFKRSATYHFNRTVAQKESEKLGRGYEMMSKRVLQITDGATLRRIYDEYVEVRRSDNFHSLPQRAGC